MEYKLKEGCFVDWFIRGQVEVADCQGEPYENPYNDSLDWNITWDCFRVDGFADCC